MFLRNLAITIVLTLHLHLQFYAASMAFSLCTLIRVSQTAFIGHNILGFWLLFIEGRDMVRIYTRKPNFRCPEFRITNLQVTANVDLPQIFRLYANRNPNEEERIVRSECYLPRIF